ncbi:elongation factor G [Streptomyces sp. t39]|uniref:elongation factor G n=1 Tax=Streptomyces sp. t39 TaxID=1828156 RepID=UPI0011CE3F05|nr:TetM/TetW/TetO/TetS family tetracycline resistance ribosomal protection protein [Streptomyces sp. t39]TXS46951.1 GTP-binding protein [Streptomyces sp. t39]
MHTLNLGILAHVDAGKTSLTERLLHRTHAIDTLGSVDAGSTRTDTLALERRRGITIKAAVASFDAGDTTVNLIDTPGHPDFVAEVERALGVLDGAVLVVSAVEGVQAQTRVLMRVLRRLRLPALIFVNKIDRGGARREELLRSIGEKLTPAHIAMSRTAALGTPAASSAPRAGRSFRAELTTLLADSDDELLAAYVDGELPSDERLGRALAAATRQGRVHPVYFGSAITGAGVDGLIEGITALLPPAGGDPGGPLSGTVFAVERGPDGEKSAWVRLFSGTARLRDRVPVGGDGHPARVTGIRVVGHGATVDRDAVSAGQIAVVRGLARARVGDGVGAPGPDAARGGHFAPPSLETVVEPVRPEERGALHQALAHLAEQDPLIGLRQDDVRHETSLSLYGEVQKEVVEATLAEEYGIGVTFRATTTVHTERLTGSGSAAEFLRTDPNPYLATVGLRVDPAEAGSGSAFRLEVEPGSLPAAFVTAIEETVARTLEQGLYGWQVDDCTVTLTHSGYAARQSHAHAVFDKSMSSTAGDFRNLTPLVLMSALRRAGTRVHEPVHRFRLEVPAVQYGPVLAALTRHGAVPRTTLPQARSYVIEGDLPAAAVHALERRVPSLTSGEGVLETAFDHYRPVTGAPPVRPRTDADPLDRDGYLKRVARRAGGGPVGGR